MSHSNRRITPTILAAALATALTAGSGVALAQTDTTSNSDASKSMIDIIQMLESKDYSKIDEIDRDHDRYDVEAIDAAGQRVELTVDGNTGEILRSERDDD